ncbi:DUF885 domain-containing protein [uncultured Jatrophihabitans sp.]|uniref:DUF885 domain-containing protein n=1 Tax=uncultured Jatrophihabitans sp. TaxID=1610747 RepID=UPI0035CA80BA
MTSSRSRSAVDTVAEDYVEQLADHDPMFATDLGLPGRDDRLPDFTPDWWQEGAQLRARTLDRLAGTTPADDTDRITIAAMRDTLGIEQELRAAGGDEARLDVLESPVQTIRMVFDLMPTATDEDWATISRRLAAVPQAVAGYTESLRTAAARGEVRPHRQVAACVTQCADNVGADGFFAQFAAQAPEGAPAELAANAQQAAQAYETLAAFLRDELLPQAPERDAVGRERYALHLRSFLGTDVDLDETYAWGQEELARIEAEMTATAERIRAGADLEQAIAVLDADPQRHIDGTDALRAWMQETSDAAVATLAGTHFDIPDEIRTLECRIAPTHTGGMYYTPPSDDLVSRPGRMWWSVPEGVTSFTTWREKSVVYHEGVPGHHLQVGQTAVRSELLNRWRRNASWVSGHGEGWALYAERLAADLGWLDDPGDYLGMLQSQALRATRVVLDIGIHCELPAPAEVGGGAWTYDKAWQFLTGHVNLGEELLRFELDRYLGWPGQAPSYKIGERFWLQLRDDVRRREGDAFDLRQFHRRALDVGSLGLDVLRTAVLG